MVNPPTQSLVLKRERDPVMVSSVLVSLGASTLEVVALRVLMLGLSLSCLSGLLFFFLRNCLPSFLLVESIGLWIGELGEPCLVGRIFHSCSLGIGRLLVGFFAERISLNAPLVY